MATALFVFDHKYPRDNSGNYYYSSGFDEEFFNRYYKIFNRFDIFGRVIYLSNTSSLKSIDFPSRFYLMESNKKLFMSKVIKKMKSAISDVDCVVARMPSIFGSLAIEISKKQNKPYIVEVVSCTYDALINSPSIIRRIIAKPAELFYRNILKNNPYTIYVTKFFLQKKYPSNGKQVACSNVTLPSIEVSALNKRLMYLDAFNINKKVIIGTTSTFSVDFKGQKYVIESMPELLKKGYDIEYQMVGDGDGNWLLEIAKRMGVFDRVKIIGHLDHEDIFKWLDSLTIYVHPSCQEGLSRAIIEAMSRACPIIAADAGGVHELIDRKYIIPIKDSHAIATAIEQLLNDNIKKISSDNFKNSTFYKMSTLYERRENFYQTFLKECGVL